MSERLPPNPWTALPHDEPYILPGDAPTVDAFNDWALRQGREDLEVHLELLPEPFLGSPDAPVVLLNLNPGYRDDDLTRHLLPAFRARSRANLLHDPAADYPFYLLDPAIPTASWWLRKLAPVIEEVGLPTMARRVLAVEFFPYHSRRFRHRRLAVPSRQYGFALVRAALRRGAVVVLMRGERIWREAVPELTSYHPLFRLSSPQNTVLSRRNCPGGFDQVLEALRSSAHSRPPAGRPGRR